MKKPTAIELARDAEKRLHEQGLSIKRVVPMQGFALRVEWQSPPTEAERALASELVPEASHDS